MNVDFGIVVSREDECQAVLGRFPKVDVVEGRRRYRIRRLSLSSGQSYTIAVLRCMEQGSNDAFIAVRDLLDDLDPAFLLIVGIAAAVPNDELSLGDVIVSTHVADFDVDSALKVHSPEYALGGPPLHPDAARLADRIGTMTADGELDGWNEHEAIGLDRPHLELEDDLFYGDAGWNAALRDHLERRFLDQPAREPVAVTGAIASSERLIDEAELLPVARKLGRQARAIEQQSAGAYRAARRRVPFLAIRAIGDVIGLKPHPDWVDYACRTAAAFTRALLMTYPIHPRATAEEAPGPAVEPTPAADLPPRPGRLVGREQLVSRLTAALLREPAPSLLLIGPGGVGKTALAADVLHRGGVAARFRQRRWLVSLDPVQTADGAVGLLSAALRLTPRANPLSEACAFLGVAPGVLVLDNLERPWAQYPAATNELLGELTAIPGLVLVASMRGAARPQGVAWSEVLDVPPLDPAAAAELFYDLAGARRDHPALPGLLARLEGIPLAIALLARAAEGASLESLAAKWTETAASWGAAIAPLLEPRMTEAAQQLLGLLKQLPDGIAFDDIPALLPDEGHEAPRRLIQAGLASEEGQRLRVLPSVRDYVRGVLAPLEKTLLRAMTRYGDLARSLGPQLCAEGGAAAVARLIPEMSNLDSLIREGLEGSAAAQWIATAVALTDLGRFSARFSPSLLEAARETARRIGSVLSEASCLQSLGSFAEHRSRYQEARQRYEEALRLFRRMNSKLGEAQCIQSIGNVSLARAEHEEARRRYDEALPLFREVRSVLGEASCIQNLGDTALRRSDLEEARRRYDEALRLFRRGGFVLGETVCIERLGDVALLLGDLDEARLQYDRALPLHRRIGSVPGEAGCLRSLGDVALRRSHHEEARRRYEEALELFRRINSLLNEAECIHALGEVALQLSELEEARRRYLEALRLFRRADSVSGEARCLKSLGDLALRLSDHTEAWRRYEEALPLFREVRDRPAEAECLKCLGDAALRRSDYKEARRCYEDALRLFRQTGSAHGQAESIHNLGEIAFELGDVATAKERYVTALVLHERLGDRASRARAHRRLAQLVPAERQHHLDAAAALSAELGPAGSTEGLAHVSWLESLLAPSELLRGHAIAYQLVRGDHDKPTPDLAAQPARVPTVAERPVRGEFEDLAEPLVPRREAPRSAPAMVERSSALAPAAPAPFENPFLPGRALTGDLPAGRAPIVNELVDLVLKGSPAMLVGPRRSGKTSLLHHIRAHFTATHEVRLVTLEGSSKQLRDDDSLARMLDPSLAVDPAPAQTLKARLLEAPAVLLIDEIAYLVQADDSVFTWLRAIGQKGTGIVLAGSQWDFARVVKHASSLVRGSSFANDVTPVTLGPIAVPDALRFLVDTAPADVPLDVDGAARWIVDLTGPWPFYLQVMGYAVVHAVRAGDKRVLEEPTRINDLYVQRLLLDRDVGYFSTRWAELPARAQRVLEMIRQLPVGEMPVERELSPEDRDALQDTGICNALGEWLQDKPFYAWIRRIKSEDRRSR